MCVHVGVCAPMVQVIDSLVHHVSDRFVKVLDHPVLKAFAVFDHRHWPADKESLATYGHGEIKLLFDHYSSFFDDTTLSQVLEQWQLLIVEIKDSPGLMSRSFKQLWPHMLCTFTGEFNLILRCVACMLLLPCDTSECERIFSLMYDIKTGKRSRLGQQNLCNLMLWHYHGKDLKPWEIPFREIYDEFQKLATGPRGRERHVPTSGCVYSHRVESSAPTATATAAPVGPSSACASGTADA